MSELDNAALFEAALTGSVPTDTQETQSEEPAIQEDQQHSVDPGTETATSLQPTEQSEAQAKAQPQVDWEARFRGLSRRYNQDRQRWQELEQRLLEYEELLIDQATSDLPEEERAYQAEMLRLAAEARRMYEAAAQQAAFNEEVSRIQTIQLLANEYQIDPRQIAHIPDPEWMEYEARRIAETREQIRAAQEKAERMSRGADRFEGSGSVSPDKKPKTEEEAAAEFMRQAQRLGLSF